VRSAVRCGWTDACRIGVAAARAPHVVVLDPGARLHPRALDVLCGSLAACDDIVVAAYGIVARSDAAGATDVRGHLGWDGDLLVRERYLDTVAMFRRDRLAELLATPAPPAITGWELHDLWLTAAERGWRAQPTGAIVGDWPQPPPGIGDIDVPTTWLALYERHPRLPWPS
jgi:hypothetical protein